MQNYYHNKSNVNYELEDMTGKYIGLYHGKDLKPL